MLILCLYLQEGKGTKAGNMLVGRHTTDTAKYGMQSVLETNDLNEIMNMVSHSPTRNRVCGIVAAGIRTSCAARGHICKTPRVIMFQADLAGRDFAAERDQAVVVSTGAAVSDLDRERSSEARAVAEVQPNSQSICGFRQMSLLCGTLPTCEIARRETACALAQERNRYRLRIPRRPAWSRDMTAEQVDQQEREAFLAWRRDLARCGAEVMKAFINC